MTGREYQSLAMRTARQYPDARQRLINGAMGLCGEAGEAIDIVKKHVFHDHPLDRDALLRELGDVLWYAALTAEALDTDLDAIMALNIEKLRMRYPNGFDAEKSIH